MATGLSKEIGFQSVDAHPDHPFLWASTAASSLSASNSMVGDKKCECSGPANHFIGPMVLVLHLITLMAITELPFNIWNFNDITYNWMHF